MQREPIKLGLLALIILQIGALFYMLHVYDDFVSSPDNFYKNILVKQARTNEQIFNEN